MNKQYKKVLKAIKKYDTIVVIRHEVPDFDASGSQFGLVTWLKDNYPNKKVYAVGKTHKYFSPSLYPATDENVLIEGKYLAIVVDVAELSRMDGKEYVEKADYLIKIDHHPLVDGSGDVVIIDEHAAAASELLADMLISFNKKLSKETAYYLYSAIVGDSGRFQYSDTNKRTFKVASKLIETGLNFQDIYEKMYMKNISEIEIVKYLYDKVTITPKGVAYYAINTEELKKLGIEREKIKAFVNLFAGYEEIKIWVQISEDLESDEDHRWRVSIRSRKVAINGVASNYKGGGHANAAGAACKDQNEIDALIKDLDNLL